MPISTILFDLDGTLLDTAPDLAHALNTTLINNQRPPLPFETIRPVVSHGAKGLLELGFKLTEEHTDFPRLRDELLNIYQQNLATHTQLFPEMLELLNFIKKQKLNWGILTNKPGWLTEPLLKQLNLFPQTNCVVSGDTLTKRKPHPEPMWHACQLLNCKPEDCIYVGDAERDIIAGKRAGMRTLIAMYGYIATTDTPHTWGADGMINSPAEIIEWLT
jgi:phosphoglycolate phosphatase